jgi:hypothetical protein
MPMNGGGASALVAAMVFWELAKVPPVRRQQVVR